MIIVISGGSCSGKTTLAHSFEKAVVVSMDNFYIGKHKMSPPYNFDEPSAVNLDLLYNAIVELKSGRSVFIPKYSMIESEPIGLIKVEPKENIIVEGIFALLHYKIREIADHTVYIDTPIEERIKRRIIRDVERGRSPIQTLEHSIQVEKMHRKYIESQKRFADEIIS